MATDFLLWSSLGDSITVSFADNLSFPDNISHADTAPDSVRNLSIISFSRLRPASACTSSDPVFNLYMNFVIIGLLCVCGLVGNTLSILILQRDPNNQVAIFLLQALAVADNLLLLVGLVTLSIWSGLLPYLNGHQHWVAMSQNYLPIIMDPVGSMSQTATVWMTVLLAVNRFIAVCKPFQAQLLSTIRRARIQVTIVAVLSFVFNFPKFFQYRLNWTYHNVTEPPDVDRVDSVIGPETMFGIIYSNALYSILVLLLPIFLLIGLNTRLIRDLRTTRQRSGSVPDRSATRRHPEENISIIMIIIVVVFIICQTPDRVFQILNLVYFTEPQCTTTKSKLQAFCNLLVIVNSSTNFVIYYMFRKSFRRILKQRLSCMFPTLKSGIKPEIPDKERHLLRACASDGNLHRINRIANGGGSGIANNPLLLATR